MKETYGQLGSTRKAGDALASWIIAQRTIDNLILYLNAERTTSSEFYKKPM